MATEAFRRLVLLRHGRTAWNLERRAQGHADVPLDEVGQAQAAAAAPRLALLSPVQLWSSDLARAAQTAEQVALATGLSVKHDERLREFSVGARQGMTWDEAVVAFPQMVATSSLGEALRDVPGAETDEDVRRRVVPALREALESLTPGETGVVVGHGGALKVGLAGLLGWDQDFVRGLCVLDNCHWASVRLAEGSDLVRLESYGVGEFASPTAIG